MRGLLQLRSIKNGGDFSPAVKYQQIFPAHVTYHFQSDTTTCRPRVLLQSDLGREVCEVRSACLPDTITTHIQEPLPGRRLPGPRFLSFPIRFQSPVTGAVPVRPKPTRCKFSRLKKPYKLYFLTIILKSPNREAGKDFRFFRKSVIS